MKTFKCLDLFAGTGGIAKGFESNGFKSKYANDIEESTFEIYKLNFPKTNFILEDINKLSTDKFYNYDVLLAGFPCQAFSIAGYRQGFEDQKGRGNLFFEIARFLKETKPKAFLLENVKNLQRHDKGKTFKIICDALEDLNYSFTYKVMNSKEFGNLPQNRERIYVVGFDNVEMLNNFSFPDPVKLSVNFRDLLEKKVDKKYYYTEKSYPKIYSKIKAHINSLNTVYQWRRKYVRANKSGVCPTLTANMGTGGHNVPLILDSKGIRKLTPRECFNMQGFPKNFKIPSSLSDTKLYKIAGNSVPVSVVKRIAKNMKKVLEGKIIKGSQINLL